MFVLYIIADNGNSPPNWIRVQVGLSCAHIVRALVFPEPALQRGQHCPLTIIPVLPDFGVNCSSFSVICESKVQHVQLV
jgi:hypothetical protein